MQLAFQMDEANLPNSSTIKLGIGLKRFLAGFKPKVVDAQRQMLPKLKAAIQKVLTKKSFSSYLLTFSSHL